MLHTEQSAPHMRPLYTKKYQNYDTTTGSLPFWLMERVLLVFPQFLQTLGKICFGRSQTIYHLCVYG